MIVLIPHGAPDLLGRQSFTAHWPGGACSYIARVADLAERMRRAGFEVEVKHDA